MTANLRSGTFSVLANDGAGRFGTSASRQVGVEPASVALSDLDGDGDDDVAVSNFGSDTLSVVRNGSEAVYPVPDRPLGVTSADLEGDGDADLAVVSQAGAVLVLLNRGDGTFSSAAYGAGTLPSSVAAGARGSSARLPITTWGSASSASPRTSRSATWTVTAIWTWLWGSPTGPRW